jgi:ABC-type bacteriocin/lantibiotic exporter with double-glycine peptidase domain
MSEVQQNTLPKAVRNLFKILKLDKKDISAIYFFAILSGLIQLSLPLGIQTIISFVQANQITASIIVLIIIVVLGVFVGGLVQIRQMQVIEKVEQKIFTRFSLEFADRLPKLNIEKLDKYHLPELVNRYFDIPALTKGIEKILLDIPGAVIQVVFGLVLLAFYHPVFIGFGAVLLIIVLLIIRFTSTQGMATSLLASDYKYKIAAWLQDMARNIKTFKYSKGTSLHLKKADELTTDFLVARTSHFKILLIQYWSFISFKIVITAAMLVVGAVLLVDNQINIGQFIAADIVIIAIINSVEKLIASLDKVYDTLTSVEKVNKVAQAETENNGNILLGHSDKGVSVNFYNIQFSYGNGNTALTDFKLDVLAGQFVCITGHSGSGKSSVLRLLTGAFQSYEGTVLVDEVPIHNYNLASLRRQTGILLSQQDIFQGTILENITMGNTHITLAEVSAVAEKIGFHTFIHASKHGYDTMLDPQGKRLSKKIRKDILLLRALVGQHRLLLLEEPFNHLDVQQKQAVLEVLKNDKKATIFITSNEAFARDNCDIVVNLVDGQIHSIQKNS